MFIVTNFQNFAPKWASADGRGGETVAAGTIAQFQAHRHRRDAVFLVNCDPRLTMALVALRLPASPPIVAVDLVLRRPASALLHPVKRFLIARADRYIHYFKDWRGIEAVFGIPAERSAFVPFKPNLEPVGPTAPAPEGDYVLCYGWSLRDYDTFFTAIEHLPFPAAIGQPNFAQLAIHGARFIRRLDQLPANLALLPEDGTVASQERLLRGARLVVLPVLKSSIVATGISTALNAMRLGKCVIGSEGPGMSDIFAGEVLTVPPEDPAALAAVIRRGWEDDAVRRAVAEAGYQYALALGGEAELHQRIIDKLAAWFPDR
jgi:glycosyltransferase involved in cell wall biosynthesis